MIGNEAAGGKLKDFNVGGMEVAGVGLRVACAASRVRLRWNSFSLSSRENCTHVCERREIYIW